MTTAELCAAAGSNPYLYVYWALLSQGLTKQAVAYKKAILEVPPSTGNGRLMCAESRQGQGRGAAG